MEIQRTDENFDFNVIAFSDITALTKNTSWCDITIDDEKLLYIQMPKCTTKKGIVAEKDKRTCELMYEVSSNETMIDWFKQLENQLCNKIQATHTQWLSNHFDLHTTKLMTKNILNYHRNGKFVLIKTTISDETSPKTVAYDENENRVDISKLSSTDSIIPIITINGISISPSGFEVNATLFQCMILEDTFINKCMINKKTLLPKIIPLTVEPLTVEPLTVEPLTTEPLTTEPLTVEPLTVEPLTTESLTTESLTVEPLTTESLTVEPLTVEPLTTESLTTEPLEILLEVNNDIEKVNINLSHPDKYKKIYTEAKSKADKLRQEAITALQEAEKIRLEYSFYESDNSE